MTTHLRITEVPAQGPLTNLRIACPLCHVRFRPGDSIVFVPMPQLHFHASVPAHVLCVQQTQPEVTLH